MKILICSLNSLGFLNPFIGLAKELTSQGHEVAFVCDQSLSDTVCREGFLRIPNGPDDSPSFQIERFANCEHSISQNLHVQFALRLFDAEVIVTNPLAYGALIAAQQTGIKVICMGFLSYLWETPKEDNLSPPKMLKLCAWRTRDLMRLFRAALRVNNQEEGSDNLEKLPFLGDLLLQRATPSTFMRKPFCPQNIQMVGSCLWESERDDEHKNQLLDWLNLPEHSDRPVVFVNHGRTFQLPRFWDALKESFKDSDYLLVANVGRMDGKVGEVPNNFYVKPYIPQTTALSRACLVIANGNSTVTLGALEHGLPMLLLPGGGETLDNAILCHDLGVANYIDESDFSPKHLQHNVRGLMQSQSTVRQCRKLQREMAQYSGFKPAALAVLGCA
jgi:MGT family glycosyltransferase